MKYPSWLIIPISRLSILPTRLVCSETDLSILYRLGQIRSLLGWVPHVQFTINTTNTNNYSTRIFHIRLMQMRYLFSNLIRNLFLIRIQYFWFSFLYFLVHVIGVYSLMLLFPVTWMPSKELSNSQALSSYQIYQEWDQRTDSRTKSKNSILKVYLNFNPIRLKIH